MYKVLNHSKILLQQSHCTHIGAHNIHEFKTKQTPQVILRMHKKIIEILLKIYKKIRCPF